MQQYPSQGQYPQQQYPQRQQPNTMQHAWAKMQSRVPTMQQYQGLQQVTGYQTTQTYNNVHDMQRGIVAMQRQGYRVVNQSSYQERPGCLSILMFGLFARSKARFVVTFGR